MLVALITVSFVGCKSQEDHSTSISHLNFAFAPLADTEGVHESAFEGFCGKVYQDLVSAGFTVESHDCVIAASEHEIAEGLLDGTYDVGFLSPDTLCSYSVEKFTVAAFAGSPAMNIESKDVNSWNDRENRYVSRLSFGYRSAFFVNIDSEKGKQLYESAQLDNLSYADFADSRIMTGSQSSDFSYIYPSLYLDQRYPSVSEKGHLTLADMKNLTINQSYSACVEALFRQQCDIIIAPVYIRLLQDSEESFASLLASKAIKGETIFDYMKVIAVTEVIPNKVIVIRKDLSRNEDLISKLTGLLTAAGNDPEYGAYLEYYGYQGLISAEEGDLSAAVKAYELFNSGSKDNG